MLFLVVVLAAFYTPVPNSEKEAILIHSILNQLNRYHFAPKAVDDQFSAQAYDLYLDRLDPGRRWLTKEDLNQLQIYKLQLDEEAEAGTYEFFNLSLDLLHVGIEKSQAYYRELLAAPFDFSIAEKFDLDSENRPFAQNDAQLKEYWRKTMKYETMTRLVDKLGAQENGDDEELVGKTQDELEAMCREDLLETLDNWYERIGKEKRLDYLSTYLNSIVNVFDPHSGYFEPVEKENFDIEMSRKLEGIGARLMMDGDFAKVTNVVVGGPAWKQGELEENDQITKVAQGNEDPIDVTGMNLNEVISMIRGKKGTEVRLTVKKVDGSAKEITIIRDVVILEEGFAKSLLLHTPSKEKIGYIRLPRFYDDFEDNEGRSCADDVAAELEKLKAENVQGIILDLRNNPGGSLRDVITMTGFFIEQGPVVQVKSRGHTAEVLGDRDPGVKWDGPLTVMVNHNSASASEIIAAALQDYNRAVVVGTTSTYGKGTVQRFFDLDYSVMGFQDIKPLGALKATIQKYYRINGGSVQLKGVTPDIILPDNYYYLATGEKDNEFAMEWTEIKPAEYGQHVYQAKAKAKLAEHSAKRVENSEVFQRILENAEKLKQRRDNSEYSLQLDTYRAEQAALEAEYDEYEKLFDREVVFGVANLPVDLPGLEGDEGRKARNDDWVGNVKKDVYIQETLNVMHDLLGSK